MGDPRCCCERPCIIFEDAFGRSDSTSIGSGWEETAGDSQIVGQELVIPPGGSVTTSKRHPVNSQTGIVTVDLLNFVPGKTWTVILNSTDEGVPGNIVTFVVDNNFTGTLTAGGESTELPSPLGGSDQLIICRNSNTIFAYFLAGGSAISWGIVTDGTDTYVTLRNDTVGSDIEFDNFEWREHSATNPGCGECPCGCKQPPVYRGLPNTLTLTWTADGDCACMDGYTFILTLDRTTDVAYHWTYNDTADGYFCAGTQNYKWGFDCSSFRLCHNIIHSNWGGVLCTFDEFGPVFYSKLPVSIQCNPLVITYPTMHLGASGPVECDVTLVITE